MKTKLFLTIVIALLVSSHVVAGNAKPNVFTNVIDTDTGYNKEYTIFNSSNMQQPEKRILCVYNTDGVLKERIAYEWKSYEGWVESYKAEYTYDNSDKPAAVAFTKWNKQNEKWSNTSEIHFYQDDRKKTVETDTDLAIAE